MQRLRPEQSGALDDDLDLLSQELLRACLPLLLGGRHEAVDQLDRMPGHAAEIVVHELHGSVRRHLVIGECGHSADVVEVAD